MLIHNYFRLWPGQFLGSSKGSTFVIGCYLYDLLVHYVIWLWYHPVTKGAQYSTWKDRGKKWIFFLLWILLHCRYILYTTPKSWFYHGQCRSGEQWGPWPIVFIGRLILSVTVYVRVNSGTFGMIFNYPIIDIFYKTELHI